MSNDSQPLVPRLRFPEFEGTKGWQEASLGELFRERQESGFQNIPLLSLMDREGIIPQEETNRKNNSSEDKSRYLRVAPGDIAYNTMRMWEGRSALAYIEGVISPAYTICVPNENVNSRFFASYFRTSSMIRQFRMYSQGLVKDTLNLKFEAFSRIKCAVPELFQEQQKIAACMSSLDDLIAAEGLKLDALKSHKKGLMQQIFPQEGETVPRLRFPEFRGAGEWTANPLSKYVASLDAGVSVNSGDRPAGPSECGILKTSCVTNGYFDFTENKLVHDPEELKRVQEPVTGDSIIISRMNTPALVGANAYVKGAHPNLYLPDRLWAAKAGSEGNMRFIAYILGSETGRTALARLAVGTSGSMKNIAKPAVMDMRITAPETPEQSRIASFLSSLDDGITAQAQKIDALKAHKKGLMQGLFPSTAGDIG